LLRDISMVPVPVPTPTPTPTPTTPIRRRDRTPMGLHG
jgi:hypothetical protein